MRNVKTILMWRTNGMRLCWDLLDNACAMCFNQSYGKAKVTDNILLMPLQFLETDISRRKYIFK